MAKKKEPMPTRQEIEMELTMLIGVHVLLAAKAEHHHTGQWRGEFPCPVCNVGTVRWSVAECNGHARAVCDRKVSAGRQCVNVME